MKTIKNWANWAAALRQIPKFERFPQKKKTREINFFAPQKKDLLRPRKKTFSLSGIKRPPIDKRALSLYLYYIPYVL